MKYYSNQPLTEKNSIEDIENVNNYYKKYEASVNSHIIEVVEVFVNKELIKVIYKSSEDDDLLLKSFHSNKYQKVNFEIEKNVFNSILLIQGYKSIANSFYIIVRKYDDFSNVICESLIENGALLEYNEFKYSDSGKIESHNIFLGESAWSIEKQKYN